MILSLDETLRRLPGERSEPEWNTVYPREAETDGASTHHAPPRWSHHIGMRSRKSGWGDGRPPGATGGGWRHATFGALGRDGLGSSLHASRWLFTVDGKAVHSGGRIDMVYVSLRNRTK